MVITYMNSSDWLIPIMQSFVLCKSDEVITYTKGIECLLLILKAIAYDIVLIAADWLSFTMKG